VIIGFSNAAVDFGLLNALILATNITQGISFSLFKALGFFVALINSYIWNRWWTFEVKTKRTSREFIAFTLVVGVSFLINVGISSFIVNYIPPFFGLSFQVWLNLASIIAVCFGLFWNFIGMRIFVFNPQQRRILKETL
jgi:putative flippase GtrA